MVNEPNLVLLAYYCTVAISEVVHLIWITNENIVINKETGIHDIVLSQLPISSNWAMVNDTKILWHKVTSLYPLII